MQRNANMLKILKKVRFCRFYWFLCRNAVPSLSPRTNFCPSIKLCNTLYTKYLQRYKWALKKYFASENDFFASPFCYLQNLKKLFIFVLLKTAPKIDQSTREERYDYVSLTFGNTYTTMKHAKSVIF